LSQELQLALARIEAQKDDIARLIQHNTELANTPIPERSKEPLYMSETEEDVRFMKEAGVLSIAEAEDMLRELDFENEQIYIDDGSDEGLI